MTDYLRDIWFELRERRLWPVAVALALALVAVPVLLLDRGGEQPAPVAQAPATADKDKLRKVAVLANEPSAQGSDLSVFDEKDPFAPRGRRLRPLRQIAADSAVTAAPDAGQGGGSGEGAGAALGPAGGGSSGGGGPEGGSAPGAGLPGGGGGGGGGRAPGPRRTTSYSYVADVTFGREGRLRRVRGLQRLEMLPDPDNPLLIFLGVDPRGENAVFLVDSTLEQGGEGTCADKACSVLSVGPGAEHRFRDEQGREYVLVVDRIRLVRVGASASTSRTEAGASSRQASTSRRERDERRRGLVSALLVDTQTVTSALPSSPQGQDR